MLTRVDPSLQRHFLGKLCSSRGVCSTTGHSRGDRHWECVTEKVMLTLPLPQNGFDFTWCAPPLPCWDPRLWEQSATLYLATSMPFLHFQIPLSSGITNRYLQLIPAQDRGFQGGIHTQLPLLSKEGESEGISLCQPDLTTCTGAANGAQIVSSSFPAQMNSREQLQPSAGLGAGSPHRLSHSHPILAVLKPGGAFPFCTW